MGSGDLCRSGESAHSGWRWIYYFGRGLEKVCSKSAGRRKTRLLEAEWMCLLSLYGTLSFGEGIRKCDKFLGLLERFAAQAKMEARIDLSLSPEVRCPFLWTLHFPSRMEFARSLEESLLSTPYCLSVCADFHP